MAEEIAQFCSNETTGNSSSFSDETRDQTTESSVVFLLKLFNAVGINNDDITQLNCVKKLKYYLFSIIMHIALFVNTFMLILSFIYRKFDVKITLACASTNILSVAAWHATRKNRNDLKMAINILGVLPETEIRIGKVALSAVLLLFSAIPTSYALVWVIYLDDNSDTPDWVYGFSANSVPSHRIILLFLTVNLYVSLQVLFPGLCSSVYCFLCYCVSKWLKLYESKIQSVNKESHIKLATEYFKILSTVELLEKAFSVPIFLIIFMHILHMFSLLASLITYTKDQYSIPAIAEAIIILLTSVLSTLAIVICASLIPDQVTILKKKWRTYLEKTVLQNGQVDKIIKLIAERDTVTMTACDIITLQKRFIFTMFGALFTYGLLVIQINK